MGCRRARLRCRKGGSPIDDPRLSRRTLIGGAAAGAAATTLSGLPGAARAQAGGGRELSADVVVVGAGLAGLTAADLLARRGRSVIVLEAEDRVGGRILDVPIGGGEVVETGAEFVGATQNRIKSLARRLGVETYPTNTDGDNVYVRLGVRQEYPSSVPVPPSPGDAEAIAAIVKLDQMASEVPNDAPQNAPNAEEWDSKTFQTWIDDNLVSPDAKFLATLATRAIFSAEPRDISLLFVLFYIAAAGNERNEGSLERLISTEGGAQAKQLVGGAQQIAEKLVREIRRHGQQVVLGVPVRRISQGDGGVRVEAEGVTASGQQVIVAIPPPLAGRIVYEPLLPAQRDQLTQRYPLGSVIKVNAVYDRPFWREKGLTGNALGDLEPIQVTFDSTPADGRPGSLLGFIEASKARELDVSSSRGDRKQAVLENFATYFGDEALRPRRYIEAQWDKLEFHRGCPVCLGTPGMLLDFGAAIRAPVGRIHWAGTETASFWNGYLDGAVRSGERAAKEVLPLLAGRGGQGSRDGDGSPDGGSSPDGGGPGEGADRRPSRQRRAAGGAGESNGARREPANAAVGATASARGTSDAAPASGDLPFTGLGVGGLVAGGLALLAGGAEALRRSSRGKGA